MIVHVFCSHYLHGIMFTKTIRYVQSSVEKGPDQMFVSSLSYRFLLK